MNASPELMTWLDVVPGARAAWDYVVGKVSQFYVIGLQDVPAWERAVQAVAPLASGDSRLSAEVLVVQQKVRDSKALFESLRGKLAGLQAEVSGPGGLGVWQLVAGLVITVAAGMLLFFRNAENTRADLQELLDGLVASGKLSASQAVELFRSDPNSLGARAQDTVIKLAVIGGLGYVVLKAMQRRGVA